MLAYGRVAAVDALGGRSEQAIEWANKAIELAREIGFENITRPLGMRGVARLDLGDRGGIEDMRAALQLSRLGLPAEDTAIAYSNVGEMVGLENLAQGRELIEAGLEASRSARSRPKRACVARIPLLRHLFHEGRWDELLEEADALIELDRARGATQIETWAITDAAYVLAHRGQTSRGNRSGLGDAASSAWDCRSTDRPAYPRNGGARRGCADDLGTADTLLAEYEVRVAASPYTDDELPVWLTTVALGLGDVARAETILSKYEPWTVGRRGALSRSGRTRFLDSARVRVTQRPSLRGRRSSRRLAARRPSAREHG